MDLASVQEAGTNLWDPRAVPSAWHYRDLGLVIISMEGESLL